MSGCLDRVRCDCECCEGLKEWLKPKRNMFASIIAGTLFSVGWWLSIDAVVEYAEPIYGAYFICGVFSTLALLMINSISTGQLSGDMYTEGCLGRRGARAWLFVGFVFAFGGLLGSLWVLIQQFVVPGATSSGSCGYNVSEGNSTDSPTTAHTNCSNHWWQGIAFFLQNLLIFVSTLVFKFGRSEEEVW